MHDLVVVIITVITLVFLLWVAGAWFDVLDARSTIKRLKDIDRHLDRVVTVNSTNLVSVVMAELYSRLSMTGEFKLTKEQGVALKLIADHILTLTICQVKNQIDMVNVITLRMNREPGYVARVNMTTNNRVELIIKHDSSDQLMYVKFHSINTLF